MKNILNIKFTRLVCISIVSVLLSACAEKPVLGVKNKKLAPCSNSPNCVNSLSASSDKSYIEPILYKVDAAILEKVAAIINAMPRTKLITKTNNYLHFEFRTLLGFVDDVEFYINEQDELHFRSASRLGHYDFNKNYNRYIEIKNKF
ncbi:DUF1499 domain-containing protein [Rickettsiaceae bacterium]|nr:DUF1499 domain-containing protein [Rickettsiaceae bacterium]